MDGPLACSSACACKTELLRSFLVCSVFLRQGLCMCPRLTVNAWTTYFQALDLCLGLDACSAKSRTH